MKNNNIEIILKGNLTKNKLRYLPILPLIESKGRDFLTYQNSYEHFSRKYFVNNFKYNKTSI